MMFRFLLGVAVGFAAAVWFRPQSIRMKQFEQGYADMQKRAEAVLIESRRILEETRKELGAAMEASRTSVQEKAGRIRTAATEPETVVGHEGETPSQPQTGQAQGSVTMQRPKSEGEKGSRTIHEAQTMPRPSDVE